MISVIRRGACAAASGNILLSGLKTAKWNHRDSTPLHSTESAEMKRSIRLLVAALGLSVGTDASAQSLLNPVGPPVQATPQAQAYPNAGAANGNQSSVLDGTMYEPPAG